MRHRNVFLKSKLILLFVLLVVLLGIASVIFYEVGKLYPVDPIIEQYGTNAAIKSWELDDRLKQLVNDGKTENGLIAKLREDVFENAGQITIVIEKSPNSRYVELLKIPDPTLKSGTVVIRQYAVREILYYKDISSQTLRSCEVKKKDSVITIVPGLYEQFTYDKNIEILRHPRAIRKFSKQEIFYFGHVAHVASIVAAISYNPDTTEFAQ